MTAAAQRPVLLVWSDRRHFDHRGDKPCALCGSPTPLRSPTREPAHKVCAEAWTQNHPGEDRFLVRDY